MKKKTILRRNFIKKDHYKQCSNCKEAYLKESTLESHKLEDNPGCQVPKPTNVANRCPLCHKDIGPLEKGWKDHLLSKQCLKNDRNEVID